MYLISVMLSFGLIFFGINAFFNSKKTADLFLKMAYPKWYKQMLQKMMARKWYFVNLRVGGVGAVFVGFLLLIAIYYSVRRA